MKNNIITISFEGRIGGAIKENIKHMLGKAISGNADINAFVDYRNDEFEDMAFIPAINIVGKSEETIECAGCEKEVRKRNCNIVIFERDDIDSDPLYFCHSCSNMMKAKS